MPTESDLTGVLPQSQMAERSSEPTSIGDRKLKPSTLMMGYGFDPVPVSYTHLTLPTIYSV